MNPNQPHWWQQIFTPRMLACIFLGFTSGLPYFFIAQLLPAWLRTEHIDLKSIGLFALVQLPFTIKFLWAPFLDSQTLPFLGRRRGWMLVTQILLLLTMMFYAQLSPAQDLKWIALLSLALCFFSASQDVVVDAFRREILSDEELGLGNSIHVNAYRIAGLVPGSLSLILADQMPWSSVFMITALFMLPGLLFTLLLAKEPSIQTRPARSLAQTVIEPLREFFQRKGVVHAALILAFLILYKLGDNLATALLTPFYLDMGYSTTDIGLISKSVSLWASVSFGILGGIIMLKIGINKALWLFGVVQIVTILGFAWLASLGTFNPIGARELWMLGAVVGAEYAGVGLGTAAFVAFIARETNPLYTATQLALLTSLTAAPRSLINAFAGFLIQNLGYVQFYLWCFVIAIPGMLLLFYVAPWKEKSH